MYLGEIKIGNNLTFYANTHTPSTGAAVDADAAPGYRVYEDETATPLLTGSMALLDDANTTGLYSEQIAVTAANGFEAGKSYTVRITGVVGGVTGVELHQFQVTTRDMDDLAIAGDAMTLADNAITSAKFDESTAFPIKVADAGSTYIARTGADSDTLETLSDQIDGVSGAAIADAVWNEATAGHAVAGSYGAWAAAVTASLAAIVAAIAALPAAVWAYATRTLTTVAATSTSATGTTLDPIVAGTTYNATITGLTIPADWHKMRLTIKSSDALADDKSTLQLLETTPADAADGLLYLNGAATTAAYGSLTVDQVAGTAVIMLKPAATSQLARADCLGYDLMCLSGTDTQTQLTKGSVSVELTETKAIT